MEAQSATLQPKENSFEELVKYSAIHRTPSHSEYVDTFVMKWAMLAT